MAYNRTQARQLLSATELDLFESSLADSVKTLTLPRLRSKVSRTRKLRDKYQDLFRRQKVATRARTASKAGTSGVANQRTQQKAKLFAEVLAKFEKRMAQLEAAQARAATKAAADATRAALGRKQAAARGRAASRPAVSSKAPASGPKASPSNRSGPAPTTESARTARHEMQWQASRGKQIQGHISSAGRRNQAKRDKR